MENAIRSSNFQYEDQQFLNRFDIGFLDAQPLDVGWDVFFLEYVIDPPISTVVTLWCSECYLKVFRFLFAVKRAEFILNQYQNNRLFLTSSDENFSLCMRVTCCLRASLRHFINILWAYLMIEGVESSWKEFEAKVWNLKNLDEILKVHYLFVEKLTLKCLINHKDVVAVIRKVIHMTVKSQEIFKSLSDLLLSEVLMSEKVQNMIKGIFQQVQDLQKSFNSEVVSLLMLFETSGIPELKLLASKLNFNDIYNN
jgi:gamma-tubulin complex component 3